MRQKTLKMPQHNTTPHAFKYVMTLSSFYMDICKISIS